MEKEQEWYSISLPLFPLREESLEHIYKKWGGRKMGEIFRNWFRKVQKSWWCLIVQVYTYVLVKRNEWKAKRMGKGIWHCMKLFSLSLSLVGWVDQYLWRKAKDATFESWNLFAHMGSSPHLRRNLCLGHFTPPRRHSILECYLTFKPSHRYCSLSVHFHSYISFLSCYIFHFFFFCKLRTKIYIFFLKVIIFSRCVMIRICCENKVKIYKEQKKAG